MKKSEFCEIFTRNLWEKKFNENSRQCFLNVKSTTFSWKIYLNFIKIGEILVQNSEKRWMKSTEFTLFSPKFKPRYLPVKNKNQKIFLIPYSTLDKLSNDTSLNSLRWIYRSAKIDWTKKNPVDYIVPPPLNRGRNNKIVIRLNWKKAQLVIIFKNFHLDTNCGIRGHIPALRLLISLFTRIFRILNSVSSRYK